MKRIFIFCALIFLNAAAYGQTYSLNLKGTYNYSSTNPYISVREAAFYDGVCYLISGDGKKILTTDSNGVPVTNRFSSVTLNEACSIYADNNYVMVLDSDALRGYTKTGQLSFTIPNPSCNYFWVKDNREIWLVSRSSISVYDYATRSLLKRHTPANKFIDSDYLRNDGNKLYILGYNLVSYQYTGGRIQETILPTSRFRSFEDRGGYLACFVGDKSLWFDWNNRTKAFFVDSGFNNQVGTDYDFLPASKKSTPEQLVIESGVPNLKVYYSQGKIYVINILPTKVEFYRFE